MLIVTVSGSLSLLKNFCWTFLQHHDLIDVSDMGMSRHAHHADVFMYQHNTNMYLTLSYLFTSLFVVYNLLSILYYLTAVDLNQFFLWLPVYSSTSTTTLGVRVIVSRGRWCSSNGYERSESLQFHCEDGDVQLHRDGGKAVEVERSVEGGCAQISIQASFISCSLSHAFTPARWSWHSHERRNGGQESREARVKRSETNRVTEKIKTFKCT